MPRPSKGDRVMVTLRFERAQLDRIAAAATASNTDRHAAIVSLIDDGLQLRRL